MQAQSIEELLDRDPLSLTESEIAETKKVLVTALRTERLVWEREQAAARITGKKVSGVSTKKKQKEEVLKKIQEQGAKLNLGALMGKKD